VPHWYLALESEELVKYKFDMISRYL